MCETFLKVYKELIQKYGLITAALYGEIEGRYQYFKDAGRLTDDGFCYITVPMIEEGLGIAKKTQSRHLKPLIDDGLIECRVVGVPRKRYFKVVSPWGQNVPNMGSKIPQHGVKMSPIWGQNVPNIGSKSAINKNKDNKNNDKNNEENRESKRKRFVPPTLEEVQAYALERGSTVDPVKFFEYYEVGNWKDAKGNSVKNWKQKMLTWERHSMPKKSSGNSRVDTVANLIEELERRGD